MKVFLVYPRLNGQVHGLWAPLGPITLGTVLEDRGVEVYLDDCSFDRDTARVEARIMSEKPDLVGLTVLTEFLPATRKILAAAKSAGAATVLGGPHPTLLPEETLSNLKDADYAAVGEAENTFPEMIEAIESGADVTAVPGMAGRDGDGRVVVAPARELLSDLDSLPIPRRELLPTHPKYLEVGALNVHAVRGCPYKCSFCQPTLDRLFGKKIRSRSPQAVADEMDWTVRHYGVRELFFVDDVFTVSKRWLGEVGDRIRKIDSLAGVRYVVNSRVDIFDEDLARLCGDMGVWIVLFGVESGSQEVLDYLNKGIKVEQTRRAFEICRRIGLKTHAYILLGSPAETRESLKATEELVDEIAPDSVHISICAPLPGTDLRKRMESEGRLTWLDLEDLDYYTPRTTRNELPISNPKVTYDEVRRTRERILKKRSTGLLLRNAMNVLAELPRKGGITKAAARFKYYRRMKHYFG